MPFYREWDPATGDTVVNRDRTGPPPPPQTGVTVQDDGVVIVANQNILPDVPPATPVQVNFPGPNEPIVGKDGRITPRWWRFLDELYRRTGGVNDNINQIPTTYLPAGSPDALTLAGVAPTLKIDPGPEMSLGSMAIAGQGVSLKGVMEPATGTVTIAGQDADRTVT